MNPEIAGTVASDIAAANKQADKIVTGIAGGMTIKQLAVAMGYKVPGSTPEVASGPVKTKLTVGPTNNLSLGEVKLAELNKNKEATLGRNSLIKMELSTK